jgi:hypothetical protein
VVRIVALVAAILVTLLIGIRAATPPAVQPASAPATTFSAERAMADIRAIAIRPHPATSEDNIRVREHLAARLRTLGIEPEERRYLIDPEGLGTLRRWTGETNPVGEMTDVVGILPGRDRTLPAVAMMAHYDTVWGSPGSGDDSAGVATILESLRAIKARGVPARDLLVLFTDGEEIGLSGARAFWPSDGLSSHVGVVVNLEARGAGGRANMFETGAGNGGMIALLAGSHTRAVASSMAVMAYRLMPNDTDFTPVRQKGLPGFNFAIMGRAEYYHSPLATIDRLDPRSLQDMGDQALGLVSALAFAPVLPGRAPDAVFFDVAGRGIIHYGIGTGWLVLLGAALTLGAAGAGAMLVDRLRPVEILHGLLAQVWLVAHAVLGLTVLNLLSGSLHGNYYNRLAQLSRLEAQAALACLAVLLGYLALRRLPHRVAGLLPALVLALLGWALGGGHGLILVAAVAGMLVDWFAPPRGVSLWGGWVGGIGLLLFVAVLLQVKAPMAAWIFSWPALLLAVAAALVAWTDPPLRQPWGWAFAALGAAAVVAPLLPLAHLAFLGVGASLPQAMAALLPIPAVAFWPLARIGRLHRGVLLAMAALLVAAASIAVQVRVAPMSPTIPAYSLDK